MTPNAVDWSEPLVRLEKLPFLIGELLRQGKTMEALELIEEVKALAQQLRDTL